MQSLKLKRIIFTALLTALVCVATMVIRIPTPGTNGYIHLGDAFVIISGILLGPIWGGLAGALGSLFADVLGGYFIYAPATFVIKGLVAVISGLISLALHDKVKMKFVAVLLGGIFNIILVTGGYLLFEMALYGWAAAVTAVVANLIQSASGLVIALVIYPVFPAIPNVRQISDSVFLAKKHK